MTSGYGVDLADYGEAERTALRRGGDGLFDVDPDPRPMPGDDRTGLLAVRETGSGRLLGGVSWAPIPHGPTVACVAYNIGITLLPAERGRGVGTAAQRLLVEYLFARTDVHRIEASTDVANHVEQRCLEQVGMQREGVLRGAQLRGGERRDIVLYAILRTDLAGGLGGS